MPVHPGERAVTRFDEAQIILREDGGMYLYVNNRLKLTQASHRFTPSQALSIRDWLQSPDTEWTPLETHSWSGCATIAYSHETGLLTLSTRLGDITVDPDKDEAFAKIVRRLKTLAPLPKSTGQPDLPNLPLPTPAQLAARTIFKRPMRAKGYDGLGGGSSSAQTQPKSASYLKSKEKLAALMAKLKVPA